MPEEAYNAGRLDSLRRWQLTKQGKLLVFALVVGVWLLAMIHGVSYWSAKAKLMASKGQGSMTERTVERIRWDHFVEGGSHIGFWVAGIGMAKLALVIAGKEKTEALGPSKGSDSAAGDPPSQ